MKYAYPTIKELTAVLRQKKPRKGEISDLNGGDEEEDYIEVRLQVMPSWWNVRTGDSSYDQDHRGLWGCGCLSWDTNCRELAIELIEEAREMQDYCGENS